MPGYDITRTVQNTIKDHHLISPGDFVILGFSGGPDSLCLFHVLKDLSVRMGFTLVAAHINHGIRGKEADDDAKWVIDYCRSNGVSCIGVTANVPAYAKYRHMTEEEAGRNVRREVFAYLAYGIATGKDLQNHPANELLNKHPESSMHSEDQNAQNRKSSQSRSAAPKHPKPRGNVRIALAHNRDDQAETVLMRVLRGTGIHGLTGIQYENRLDEALLRVAAGIKDDELKKTAKTLNISVIRPLLDVPRTEIEHFCSENELEPRIDRTNAEADYTRNKIRLELLPFLEEGFNPNIKETLVRLAANAAEDDAVLTKLATGAAVESEKVLELAPSPTEEEKRRPEPKPLLKSIQLNAGKLRALDPAIFKRVIVTEFEKLGLNEGISAVHLNALYGAVKKNVGGKTIEFPGGHTAELLAGTLTLK